MSQFEYSHDSAASPFGSFWKFQSNAGGYGGGGSGGGGGGGVGDLWPSPSFTSSSSSSASAARGGRRGSGVVGTRLARATSALDGAPPVAHDPDQTLGGYILSLLGRMLYSHWGGGGGGRAGAPPPPPPPPPPRTGAPPYRRTTGGNLRGPGEQGEGGGYAVGTPMSRVQWRDQLRRSGARVKLMQTGDFPDQKTGEASLPAGLNLGMGANFDLDTQTIEPRLRVRARYVALRVLPIPEMELRAKWALGTTNLAVDIRYSVPVEHVAHFWESPARLSIALFNPMGTGVHLTPNGVEFDEHVLHLGRHTNMRVAATLQFPRRFPLEQGDEPFHLCVRRLGLRTRIA
ncbi:hypothetical protein CBR_g48947 [Chara braunii]|uniref:Uncharacterized protein n=1 Tax=Chara braunii TaxID=69332 RepID=A0A388M456_CHABU|nr:hypothetical protein CBR_g48947 [Chara braunii]|eukprot:GBG89239.1 hypothetical protein CBR_g48947 [Chara braunii]